MPWVWSFGSMVVVVMVISSFLAQDDLKLFF
jgi:hypothetical protein